MKKRILICLAVLTALLCPVLAACNGGDAGETTPAPTDTVVTTPTETPIEAPTEEATEAPAEETTEMPTEAPTEAVTEPETEAPPALMTVVDLSAREGIDLTDYFTRSSKCAVTMVEDEAEGSIARLASEGITTVGTAMPTTYFQVGKLVEDLHGLLPATTAYPYLVMKVRAPEVWSRSLTYCGGTSVRDAGNLTGNSRGARLSDSDGWQYILLDLSSFKKDVTVLYLNFEYGAAKDGEYMDIAELHFFETAEEAAALVPLTDTYPLEEVSIDNYQLKIISYNIWVGNGTDHRLRADILRDFIDGHMPDSIGLQEVHPTWRSLLDTYVFNESYEGIGEERSAGGESSAIYYRKDKFELLDYGTFWLSDTPDVVGSMHPDSGYPRVCTWVKLRCRTTGFEYVHVNTHLDHLGGATGRAVRLFQAKVMLEFVSALGDLPMVMTGDFNQLAKNSKDEYYPLYKLLTGMESFTTEEGVEVLSAFSDSRIHAAETVPADRTATMTQYYDETYEKYNPSRLPIDYVFYTAKYFEPLSYDSFLHHRDGVYTSDHLPVLTVMKYNGTPTPAPDASGETVAP